MAWNIWNLNGLFSNYYQAIFNAQSTVTNELQNIIDTIDPVQTVNAALNDILTALTVGLAFIPEFEAAGAVRIFGVPVSSFEPKAESRDMSREHSLLRRVLKLATPPQTSRTDSDSS